MPEGDLNDALLGFTNYVQNERVRSYNEGFDAGIDKIERLREALTDIRQIASDPGEGGNSTIERIAAEALKDLKD